MYYVYEWYVIETGYIFYVGKGTGNRYKVKKRNRQFNDMIANTNCDSRIIEYFDNEQNAYIFEAQRIKELKEQGQCSCNINSGGAGGSGDYWTDELRQDYSVNNVMKRPEQRLRMSINNPMKNKNIAAKTNAQKRCRIQIGNNIYASIQDAAINYQVSKSTIGQWCAYGENNNGEKCINLDKDKSKNVGAHQIPFMYKDKLYNTYEEFKQEYNVKHSTLKNWLRVGYDPTGNICRRVNDNRELKFHEFDRSTPIIINGIHYKSISQASSLLSISRYQISNYLNGKSFNSNYICTYDNQQPS